MRTAVIGHVEWVHFVRVPRLPREGEILHATESWEEPAGGAAVAAVQLLRLSGDATLYTALGDDDLGRRAARELESLGLRVEAAFRGAPQRRAVTFIDDAGERTITTIGERLGPAGSDPLPWDRLSDTDTVYFTAGDGAALRAGRTARVLVATARVLPHLARAGVQLDAVVGSARDPSEEYVPGAIEPPPRLVVLTEGADGGRYMAADGTSGRYDPSPPPGRPVDAYGAGDSFAAGLAYGLASEHTVDAALRWASRWGAAALTRRGAHGTG